MPTSAPPRLALTNAALFLDFDGTLVPFDKPDEHTPVVDDGLRSLLAELRERTEGALAIISGRTIAVIDDLFEPLFLAASGEHGGEWRETPGGTVERIAVAPGLEAAHLACEAWALATPGVRFERKRLSLVLHFHRQPDLRNAAAAIAGAACPADSGLVMMHARGMVEIKPVGAHKGIALNRFLQLAPFAGRRPIFIGDDITDEDGFAAANAVDGISIKVGSGSSRAHYRLPDEDAVRAWLEAALD